jgi:hypothetical protein
MHFSQRKRVAGGKLGVRETAGSTVAEEFMRCLSSMTNDPPASNQNSKFIVNFNNHDRQFCLY